MPAALHGPAGPSTPRARGKCHHTKRRTRGAGGAPGMVREGACPNLLQRRSGLGSATEESAEYQRFSRASRLDPGLCNRFGQPAPLRAPGGAPRAGRRPRRHPDRPGGPTRTSTRGSSSRVAVSGPGRLLASGVYFALEKPVPTAALESGADISARKGPTASDEGRFRRPTPFRSPIVAWWGSVSHVVTRSLCLDHLRAVGPLMFRWTTVFRAPGGPTEHKWSKQKSAAMSPLATLRPAPASPSYEY